jgi:hypothetical protein
VDDIVSKLRYAAHEIIIGDDIEVVPATYLLEAAAEIELLRQRLVEIKIESDFYRTETMNMTNWLKLYKHKKWWQL